MLEKTTQDFRAFFLLQFTKELIKNSRPKELFVEKNLETDMREVKPFLVKRSSQKINSMEIKSVPLSRTPRYVFGKKRLVEHRGLYIPDPQLPPNLQYLQPIPTNLDLDLGKLNPLIRDSAVKVIECNGEDEKIVVKGKMGTRPTGIVLNKGEIEDVIERFSIIAKIPVHEGIFKVVAGRLILTAIISEVISFKFIIKKMTLPIGNVFGNLR